MILTHPVATSGVPPALREVPPPCAAAPPEAASAPAQSPGPEATEPAWVRLVSSGVGVRLVWAGRSWRVISRPVRWFDDGRLHGVAPRPQDAAEHEQLWRVEVMPADVRRAVPRTLWLRRLGEEWLVIGATE